MKNLVNFQRKRREFLSARCTGRKRKWREKYRFNNNFFLSGAYPWLTGARTVNCEGVVVARAFGKYSIIFARLFEIVSPEGFPLFTYVHFIYIHICIGTERERTVSPGPTAGFKLERGKLIQSSKFIGWKSSRRKRATSLAGGGQSCPVGLTLSHLPLDAPLPS